MVEFDFFQIYHALFAISVFPVKQDVLSYRHAHFAGFPFWLYFVQSNGLRLLREVFQGDDFSFLNWEGVFPVIFLKALLNADLEL